MRQIVEPLGRLASGGATVVGGFAARVGEGLSIVRPRWGDLINPYHLGLRSLFAVRQRLVADLVTSERRQRAAAATVRGVPAGRDLGPGPVEQADQAARRFEAMTGESTIADQLVEGAVLGDFKKDPSGWHTIGQIAVGFVPYAGQVADLRDTVASINKLRKGGWRDPWEWVNLGLTLVGWVPGLGDVVKGLGRGGMRILRGSGSKIAKVARQLWTGARTRVPQLLGKAKAIGKHLLSGARLVGRRALQAAEGLGRRAADAGRRLWNGARALGGRAVGAAADLLRRAGARGGELLGRGRALLGRAAVVVRGLAGRAFREAESAVTRGLRAVTGAWQRVRRVAADVTRGAAARLQSARRWAAETAARARTAVGQLVQRARMAASRAWNRAVASGRALVGSVTGRVRMLVTRDLPQLTRRLVTWAGGKVRSLRRGLQHGWNVIKERGYRLAQKVGLSTPTIGHAKPWTAMSAAERKAFQHSYNRHAADFGLPNWSGKNAEQLRQQFTARCAEIRQQAQRITVEYKPVGTKGSGVSGGTEPVRFFHYTDPSGTRWYYYETLAGRFVSAGRNRP